MELTKRDGELLATTTIKGPLAELLPKTTEEYILRVAGSDDVFVTRQEDSEGWTPVVFFDLPDGTRCIHFGARATPRTSTAAAD